MSILEWNKNHVVVSRTVCLLSCLAQHFPSFLVNKTHVPSLSSEMWKGSRILSLKMNLAAEWFCWFSSGNSNDVQIHYMEMVQITDVPLLLAWLLLVFISSRMWRSCSWQQAPWAQTLVFWKAISWSRVLSPSIISVDPHLQSLWNT